MTDTRKYKNLCPASGQDNTDIEKETAPSAIQAAPFSKASAIPPLCREENPIRVACVQMDVKLKDISFNLKRAENLIREAAGNGAKLIVLPELFSTGYTFQNREEVYQYAETVPDGQTSRFLAELSKKLSVYIVGSILEQDGVNLYNCSLLTGPEGIIGTYRKLHLCGDEIYWMEPGNLGLPVFHTKIGRIALLICLDGFYPETYRICALQGADIICVSTNWSHVKALPAPYKTMGPVLTMANALSNHIFIAAASRIGSEPGLDYPGQSVIAGVNGAPLSGPAPEQETIIYADCNLADTRKRYLDATNSRLGNRRTDVYDKFLGYRFLETIPRRD